MVKLDPSETSKALAVSGGYVVIVGLVSYFIKEKLFMCSFKPFVTGQLGGGQHR